MTEEVRTEEFVIDNDEKADWAIEKISDATVEKERLVKLAETKIEKLNQEIKAIENKFETDTSYLKFKLAQYFETVPHRETKTQETYKLLSGTLYEKKASAKMTYVDDDLIKYLKETDCTEFIKTTEKVAWADYKACLEIVNGVVINTKTGEVIDCISVVESPAEFGIKFKK